MRWKGLAIVAAAAALLIVMFVLPFAYRFTAFYKDCMRVKEGMNQREAEGIMQPYINSGAYHFSREGALWGPGLYVSSNTSNNQCNIGIKDGKVARIDPVFD